MPRVVRCTIEMDMVEEEHFRVPKASRSMAREEELLQYYAKLSFLDTIDQLENEGDLFEYIQCKVVEDVS